MAVTTLKDGRVMCYYKDPITRKLKKEYFGRGPEAMAKARIRNEELGLRRGRPPKKHVGPSFAQLSKLYYNKKGFNKKPRETLSYRLDNINRSIGHLHAMSLTNEHLEDYVDLRRENGMKDNSIRREITDIKAILNWSVGRKPPLIPFNPVRDFKGPPDNDEIIMPPDPEELAAIYENACPHLKRFISLASYVGCRPGAVELLSLTWESVRFSSRLIRVLSADKGGPPYRDVAIHDDFYPLLEAWYSEDKEYFEGEKSKNRKSIRRLPIVNYWGERITTIKRAWKSALDGAKITRRIRPYDLRHRFVTLALENGADIGALADIVGSKPETLRKYYQHVTKEMHRKTINSIPNLGIKNIPKDQDTTS